MPIVPIKRTPPPEQEAAPSEPEAYDVGYRKPPRHTQFKTGQSGNPGGRPKGAKGFKTIIRSAMLEKVRVRTGGGERKVSRAEALVLKAIEMASKDNFRATERLLGWYQEAVAEPFDESPSPDHEELSAADLATLAALRESIEAELASDQPNIRRRTK
jgi:hypothetical protein